MNTNQRIKATDMYQWADVAWNCPMMDVPEEDMPIPDFIRIYGPFVKLPSVIHRISRGWTSRDALIIKREEDRDIPF